MMKRPFAIGIGVLALGTALVAVGVRAQSTSPGGMAPGQTGSGPMPHGAMPHGPMPGGAPAARGRPTCRQDAFGAIAAPPWGPDREGALCRLLMKRPPVSSDSGVCGVPLFLPF